MAEAQREEEAEGGRRNMLDVRSRSQTTDRPERTKPDHSQSSQRRLSTLRAAIKRNKTNSPSDHSRDRRRPEITIVAAEPLAANSWFSGTTVVFAPPPHPPPQPDWSAGLQAVPKPPPSYDQVIQEKNQEEHPVKPTAAPRRTSCTTTSSTQTDPEKKRGGKTPKKPPRPSLPRQGPKAAVSEHIASTDKKFGANTLAPTNTKDPDSQIDAHQPNQAQSSPIWTRSVTVHWDFPHQQSSAPTEAALPSSDSLQVQRPVPLPRTKTLKQTLDPEESPLLVRLSESSDGVPSDPEDAPPNEYLKELLEAFTADCSDSDAEVEMNTSSTHRNIRARIQAFESQTSTEEPAKPEPQPRTGPSKPPVAAKPSIAVKPQINQSTADDSQNVSSEITPQNPTPAPRPQPPKKPQGLFIKEELDSLHSKKALNSSRPVLTRAKSIYEEDVTPDPPKLPVRPVKEPLKPNLNINNHNSTSMSTVNQYVDSPTNPIPIKPLQSAGGSVTRPSVTRRPTTIRVPSKTGSLSDNFQDGPPPLPTQKPVGNLDMSVNPKQSVTSILPRQESVPSGPEPSLPPRRLSTSKTLPPRPPPAKVGPGRPPPPNLQAAGRSQSVPWEVSPKPQTQKPHRKGPVLPPRPNPGHRLYNKYTLPLSHAIAASDYSGGSVGELSFQKNEVLLLMKEIDQNTFECQVGDARGRVHKSRLTVITPLDSDSHLSPPQAAGLAGSGGAGLKVQAMFDFTPEGPGELGLRVGDLVTMVEQVDGEWYRGTCRGSTGFFPTNYVKVLSGSPKPIPEQKAKPPPAAVSGPRCVARFDFEGEHSDELSFSDGDVIRLTAYVGQEWARGQVGANSGIFPLNFVEVVEDLPPPSSPQRKSSIGIALPGMVASPNTHPEVGKPAQTPPSSVEWVVALYDFAGSAEDDLSFQEGDRILISRHIDAEWSCGRLNGREGIFPRAFVQSSTGQNQGNAAEGGSRARALYDFTSDCEEELSLRIGDIVTGLESVDDEWFLGDLRGKRALVPKNYVQVLG
ncbi:uncharacterized protein V6R79_005775 [Siganus canaliculatus]